MKAAVLYGQKDIRVEEIEKPSIEKEEVLIKVKATGICGSDIPRVLGKASHYYPNVLGHEFAGVVSEIGENVSRVKVGDKVAVAPLKPCHQCDSCLSGHYALCQQYSFIGSREYGGWAEYAKVPERNTVKLPDKVTFTEGAFLEPITVALHGLFVMDFKPMTKVAIIGMGTIGLLTLQCARIMGAKDITVFDVDNQRLAIAKKLGADHVINTLDKDMDNKIEECSHGQGFEMVLETAGVPATEILSMKIAGNKGNVMFIGTPHTSLTLQPKEFEYMNRKELTLRGSWMSYSAPFPGGEWKLAAHYLGTGDIRVKDLLDREIPIEDINKAFEDIENKRVSGKIMMYL